MMTCKSGFWYHSGTNGTMINVDTLGSQLI